MKIAYCYVERSLLRIHVMSDTITRGKLTVKWVTLIIITGLSIYSFNFISSITGSSVYIEAGLGNYTAVLSAVVVLNFFLKGRPE